MLTSASQYLQPDYLQPLPTTLDAKKSPLALLAQTCSAIGKDTGPTKPIIPPLDKKDKDKDINKDKGGTRSVSPGAKSGTSGDGRISRPGSNISRKDGSPKDSSKSFRTPPPKEIPPLVPISKVDSEKHRTTPAREGLSPLKSPSAEEITVSASGNNHSGSSSRISLNCGSLSLEVSHSDAISTSSASKSHHSIPTTMPPSLPSSLKHESLHAAALGHYPGLPLLGHHFDPTHPAYAAASLSAAQSSLGLAAAHKAALAQHPGMSPYVRYTTVKTATGATTLVPVCSDPYCTHCKLTMQSAQLGTSPPCTSGCTQCTHEKSPLGQHPTSLASHYLPGLHGLASTPGASSLSLSSSLYPHAFGVVPSSHGLPYVCNWVAGTDYCGKRFSTPEELLSHLRSHTSSSEAAGLPAGLSPYINLPGISAAAALHPSYSTPGSISPNSLNSLRQAYPRSLSPNTLLAASRYHPYKSPLSSLSTPGAPASLPGFSPSLSPYYSPYALYGQRLGAAVAP